MNKHKTIGLYSKLYTSSRIHKHQLGTYWVLFAPDSNGLPIVVDPLVNELVDSFVSGAYVHNIIDMHLKYSHYNAEELLACINTIYKKGILKNSPTPHQYTPIGFGNYNHINSCEIWLHITNECNLRCSYCFVHKDERRMDTSTINKVVDNIVYTVNKWKIPKIKIKFAGGEPTLNLAGMQLVYDLLTSKCINTNLSFAILSNGTIINKEIIKFLHKKNVGIGISVDGYGASSHDIHRKFKDSEKGSWEIILNNIKILMKNGIKPYILSTISEESSKSLGDLVKWIFKNKLKTRLSVVRPSLDGNNCTLIMEKHGRFIKTMIESFDQAFKELEKLNYDIDIQNSLKICELRFEQPSFGMCCGIGSSHIVIKEDGMLASCPMKVNNASIPCNDDLLMATRSTFTYPPESRSTQKCLHCKWFPVCVGGCPITNEQVSGSPFSVSPLHDFYKYVIPRFINFCGTKILQQATKNNLTNFHILSV